MVLSESVSVLFRLMMLIAFDPYTLQLIETDPLAAYHVSWSTEALTTDLLLSLMQHGVVSLKSAKALEKGGRRELEARYFTG
ncbi:unnamed protein product [Gongylonema pulchrum]|uniref:Transposase n=1 Tax=Gongylonema pulchrum TaxID=637853 RepID=A0A183ETW2_9BILA|nr:unnamed protein product [Gongylonema pulchrum]